MESAATVPRISGERLSELLLAQHQRQQQLQPSVSTAAPPLIRIIDVRDEDHVGGHILGSTHFPSATLAGYLPVLVRTCADADIVVFHCALSQARGPKAAARYLNARGPTEKQQDVVVLEDGFNGWQQRYGADERLTEGWIRGVWESGFVD